MLFAYLTSHLSHRGLLKSSENVNCDHIEPFIFIFLGAFCSFCSGKTGKVNTPEFIRYITVPTPKLHHTSLVAFLLNLLTKTLLFPKLNLQFGFHIFFIDFYFYFCRGPRRFRVGRTRDLLHDWNLPQPRPWHAWWRGVLLWYARWRNARCEGKRFENRPEVNSQIFGWSWKNKKLASWFLPSL